MNYIWIAGIAVLGVVLIASSLISGSRAVYAAGCDGIPVQALAQLRLKVDPSDPGDLDGPDDNGVACDSLPCPCDLDPVTEAIGYVEPQVVATEVPPTATETATSLPAVATATPLSPTETPIASSGEPPRPTPVPFYGANEITPPSTGSGGLR